MTSIGDYAFKECTSLTSINIPNSVNGIAYCAFWYCTSLTDVYYTGTEEEWEEISISISSSNDSLTSAVVHYNSEISDISSNDGNTGADGNAPHTTSRERILKELLGDTNNFGMIIVIVVGGLGIVIFTLTKRKR